MARNVIDILDDLAKIRQEIYKCSDRGESAEAELRRLQIQLLAFERERDQAGPH